MPLKGGKYTKNPYYDKWVKDLEKKFTVVKGSMPKNRAFIFMPSTPRRRKPVVEKPSEPEEEPDPMKK